MCRADLTERAAEEKDMLVLAKEEENIVVNKPALSQIRSICELATLECYYHNVESPRKQKVPDWHMWEKKKKILDRIHRSC